MGRMVRVTFTPDWPLGFNDILCSDGDGNLLEGAPPAVDVAVALSEEDIGLGVDTVIAAAEDWILAP